MYTTVQHERPISSYGGSQYPVRRQVGLEEYLVTPACLREGRPLAASSGNTTACQVAGRRACFVAGQVQGWQASDVWYLLLQVSPESALCRCKQGRAASVSKLLAPKQARRPPGWCSQGDVHTQSRSLGWEVIWPICHCIREGRCRIHLR